MGIRLHSLDIILAGERTSDMTWSNFSWNWNETYSCSVSRWGWGASEGNSLIMTGIMCLSKTPYSLQILQPTTNFLISLHSMTPFFENLRYKFCIQMPGQMHIFSKHIWNMTILLTLGKKFFLTEWHKTQNFELSHTKSPHYLTLPIPNDPTLTLFRDFLH